MPIPIVLNVLRHLSMITLSIAIGSPGRPSSVQPDNVPPVLSIAMPSAAAPGSLVKGVATVTFEKGLHAYQNPPTEPYMIPVQLVSATSGIMVKVNYPAGAMMITAGEDKPAGVYMGTVKIPFEFRAPKKPGKLSLMLRLKYQQCNLSGCFPPGEIKQTRTITLKASKRA